MKLLYILAFKDNSQLRRKKLLQFEGLCLGDEEVSVYAERLAADFTEQQLSALCVFLSLDHSGKPAELETRLSKALDVFDNLDREMAFVVSRGFQNTTIVSSTNDVRAVTSYTWVELRERDT